MTTTYTPNLHIPVPDGTEVADGPSQLEAIADVIDDLGIVLAAFNETILQARPDAVNVDLSQASVNVGGWVWNAGTMTWTVPADGVYQISLRLQFLTNPSYGDLTVIDQDAKGIARAAGPAATNESNCYKSSTDIVVLKKGGTLRCAKLSDHSDTQAFRLNVHRISAAPAKAAASPPSEGPRTPETW